MIYELVERRLYTRAWNESPILVFYSGVLVMRTHTINFSVGGLLAESKDIGLTENSLIEIMFDVYNQHDLYGVKIPSLVSRYSGNHMAISFEQLEKATEDLVYDTNLSEYPVYH